MGVAFLSVLICLIGASAVICLEGVVQDDVRGAVAESHDADGDEDAVLEALRDSLAWVERRIHEQRAASRRKNSGEDEAGRLQGRLTALRTEVAEWQARLDFLQDLQRDVASLRRSRAELERRLVEVTAESQRLSAQLRAIRSDAERRGKTFSVRSLSRGGVRESRPTMFVECSASGVTLQPAGTHMPTVSSAEEQEIFLSRSRKLGYVVFLIRPDGLESFERYRSLVVSENRMSEREIDVGFEPVDADWILVFPG